MINNFDFNKQPDLWLLTEINRKDFEFTPGKNPFNFYSQTSLYNWFESITEATDLVPLTFKGTLNDFKGYASDTHPLFAINISIWDDNAAANQYILINGGMIRVRLIQGAIYGINFSASNLIINTISNNGTNPSVSFVGFEAVL